MDITMNALRALSLWVAMFVGFGSLPRISAAETTVTPSVAPVDAEYTAGLAFANACAAAAAPAAPTSGAAVTIRLADGTQLDVTPGTDPLWVANLVRTLRPCSV
jgi:hypothetical protein